MWLPSVGSPVGVFADANKMFATSKLRETNNKAVKKLSEPARHRLGSVYNARQSPLSLDLMTAALGYRAGNAGSFGIGAVIHTSIVLLSFRAFRALGRS